MAQTANSKDGWPVLKTAVVQHHVLIILLMIMLVGAGLRLTGLATQSLWNDELSGWRYSQVDSLSQVLKYNIPADHPPGYQVFLYFWIHAIGDTEFLLRLPFALAGIATIFAMFLLGRRMYSATVGLIAAAFTAVLWTPLFYSQEARANIMILLFAVLATYWLLAIGQALQRDEKMPGTAVVGYVISAVLASYLHYFGLFFVLLQGGLMGLIFLFKPRAWSKLFLVYGLIFLAYLPWLNRGANALLSGGTNWLAPPEPEQIVEFYEFLFNRSTELTQVVFLLWGFLLVKGIWTIWRQPQRARAILYSMDGLLVVWLIVPVLLVFVKSLVSTPAFTYRSLIIVLPAAYLLLARAITLLPFRRLTTPLATIILLTLFSYELFWQQDYYHKPTKEQFREAVAFVSQNEANYPDAFIMGFTWAPIYLDYYFERQGSEQRVDIIAGDAADIEEARAAIEADPSLYFWYIFANREPDEAFEAFLNSEMVLLKQETLVRAEVRLYAKESE